MSKHTPGPWVYGPEFSAVMTRDKQGTVAILLPLGHTRDDEDIDTEMMDAHGRLLAAAPELLDLLSECLEQLEALHYLYEGEFSERIEAADKAAVKAWKLIAKLTAE